MPNDPMPKYKIEVYHGANLIHTIETEADVVRASECLSSEVGTFSFTVPAKVDGVIIPSEEKTFGYTTKGATATPLEDYIRGSVFSLTDNGTAQSITAAVKCETVARKFKCAIYRHSDLSLVGVTEEITVPIGFNGWQTFNFSEPKPTLTTGTDYILVAWTEAGTDYGRLFAHAGAANQGHYQSKTYDGFPDTLSPTHDNYECSIYCTYKTPAIDTSYPFNDIVVDDKVKIWFAWDTVAGDPFLVGKIYHISAPLQTEKGFVRVFSGMDLGEVLQRSLYTNYWTAVDADVIVTELATYAGLGTSFSGDASDDYDVTLNVEDKKLWDIIREISDYWVSAGVQINKDFFVDINNNLVWKTRPLRTVGVETLTLGDNILSYDIVQNLSQVYNNITVYGESGKIGTPGKTGRCEPLNKDLWTVDDIANWTAIVGAISVSTSSPKVGANCLRCVCVDAGKETQFRRTFTAINCYGVEAYQTLNFFIRVIGTNVLTSKVKLLAPDIDNYFEANIPVSGDGIEWLPCITFQLGQNQECNDYNPTGIWTLHGSPDWQQISGIDFDLTYSLVLQNVYIDGLYFGHGRFHSTATDATYGARDLVVVDNALHSDAECESRANILLERMKLPTTQLEITLKGNPNVKKGDRIPITLVPENIDAVDFDVLNVEHTIAGDPVGFITKAVLNTNERQRDKVPNTPLEMVKQSARSIQRLLKAQEKAY
jgi:hypothetical protein